MPDLLSTWNRLNKEADTADADVLERMARAYASGYRDIDPAVIALVEQIEALQATGKVTKAQIQKSAAYRTLIESVERELEDYSAYMRTEIRTAAEDSARRGLTAEQVLLAVAIGQALGGDIPQDVIKLPESDTLRFLADYLDPRGPLFGKIQYLAGYHSVNIADGILERVALGQNPRVIGKWITDAYGVGLTDSLRMTRTVQLYSYRQSNAAMQRANSDVLQGLVWVADVEDSRTCMSCIALHGQVFPVGSVCDDHHNGRCALIPWVNGMPNPIEQTGADYFAGLSEAEQKTRMGESKWQAWQGGKFEFSQLTRSYQDEVYGEMRGEASLKSLLGEE